MTSRNSKFVGIGLLIIGLFWTRVEELDTELVSIFGGAITLWVVRNYQWKKKQKNVINLIIPFVWGITPVTLILMMVKNGIHAHSFLEYSLTETKQVLMRMPYLLVIGYGVKYFVDRKESKDIDKS